MEGNTVLKSNSTISEGQVKFLTDLELRAPATLDLDPPVPDSPLMPPPPPLDELCIDERVSQILEASPNDENFIDHTEAEASKPNTSRSETKRRKTLSFVFSRKSRSALKEKTNADMKSRTLRSEMSRFFAKQNVNRDNFELKDLTESFGVKVNKHETDTGHNIRKAACYLTDAFHGRLQNGLGSTFEESIFVRYAFRIHMTDFYRYLLRISSIVLMVLVFVEPASFANRDQHDKTMGFISLLVELFLVLILSTDMVLRFLYMGYAAIAKKYFLRLHVYVLAIALIDVIVALALSGGSFRVSRVLRPLFFVLLDKSTLQLSRQCVSAERKLRVLASLLVFTVCVFSLLISCFCSQSAWEKSHQTSDTNTQSLSGNWDHNWRPFQDFAHGLTPLLSLITVDGYRDIVQPWTEEFPELVAVFYGMILACTYVLLNLAVAIQVDEFQRLHTKSTTNEEAKLLKTLTVVFYLTRDEDTQMVTFDAFRDLMLTWKPNMKITLINGLFQSVAAKAKELDLEQFLEVCDGLRSEEANSAKHYNDLPGLIALIKRTTRHTVEKIRNSRIVTDRWFLTTEMEFKLHTLISKPMWTHFFGFVIACNFVLFAVATDDDTGSTYSKKVLLADFVCLGLFVFECLVSVWIESWRVFWSKRWNRYHFGCVLFAALVYIMHPVLVMYFGDRLRMQSPILSIHKLAFIPRAFRLLKGLNRFEQYIGLILKVVPVLSDFSKLIMCFMYAHAIVCMEVLWEGKYYSSTKNAVLSQLMLLQMDGWENTVYDTFDGVNKVSKYFGVVLICGFIWYFTIIILSQLMATMYDIFKVHRAQEQAPTNAGKSGRTMGLDLRKGKTPWRFYALGDAGKEIKRKLVHQVRRASECPPFEMGLTSPTPNSLSSTNLHKSYSLAAAVATFPDSPRGDLSARDVNGILPNITESPREMTKQASSRIVREFSTKEA